MQAAISSPWSSIGNGKESKSRAVRMSVVASNKFFTACSTGKAGAVRAYLDGGVDPDARDQYRLTGLIWAGRKGRIEVAKLLISRGADVEAGDVRGRTALFHAVTYKRYEFVEFLVKHGANVNPVDTHGWTPLDFARTSRHMKMVALLERLGGKGKAFGRLIFS
jgi:ankyrin repeat-rich membrane spanning protein